MNYASQPGVSYLEISQNGFGGQGVFLHPERVQITVLRFWRTYDPPASQIFPIGVLCAK